MSRIALCKTAVMLNIGKLDVLLSCWIWIMFVKLYYQKQRFFKQVRKFMFAYSLFYKYKNQLTTFVILHFRNTFMHFLRRLFPDSRFILIDDGFATYEAYHSYIKDGYFLPYNFSTKAF